MRGTVAFVLGFFMMWFFGWATAHAQMAPMPLYQHPAKGMPDPYASWPSCCSGNDCVPWEGADVERTESGYYIRSLGVEVLDTEVHPSFNGQYHVCKPIQDGDIRNKYIVNGRSMIYCLFVPSGM